MTVIACGVSYDIQTKKYISCVLIHDTDGGQVEHINPHKNHAAKNGHGWIDIDISFFNNLQNNNVDISKNIGTLLDEYIKKKLGW